MKKALTLIALGLLSTMAHAKVTIQTDNRVEILAVNQVINSVPKQAKGDLKIENGVNQMLIRVTAMVDGNGGKQKFNSLPMVVKFEGHDETLKFETPFPIRDERAVTRFKSEPQVKVTSGGQAVTVESDIIYDQTFALIKDYDEMLHGYNLAGGKAAISVASQPQKVSSNVIVNSSVENQGKIAPSFDHIQHGFLEMTPAQRQEFISWAVKHIND